MADLHEWEDNRAHEHDDSQIEQAIDPDDEDEEEDE